MQSIKYKRVIFLDEEGNGLSPYADFLLKQKLQERGIEGIEVSSRGAVVLFPEPANQKIKELAKMKGLSLEDYQAEALNGTEFSEKVNVESMRLSGIADDPVTLLENEYFVLGDNRNLSEDSRYSNIGLVSINDIIGKAVLRISPKVALIDKLNLNPEHKIE